MTEAEPDADAAPGAVALESSERTDWMFVLPRGWQTVRLDDPSRIDDRVRSLVVDRLGRRDDRARARRETREHLAAAAKGAAGAGGLSLTVFGMDLAGVVVTGTMAVFGHEASEESADELLARLTRSLAGADVDRRALDDGWVLRAVRQSEIGRTDADGNAVLPELRADYWTDRDGLGRVLHVSFTTPFVPLRDALVELFDAIVLSLHPVVRG